MYQFIKSFFDNKMSIFEGYGAFNIRANSFRSRVIDDWNSLPEYAVLAASVNNFKSRLNKHWHGQPLKFEAACYIPEQPQRVTLLRRSASPEVTE